MESQAVARANFLPHKTVMVTDCIEDLVSFQVENTNGLLLMGGAVGKSEDKKRERETERDRQNI